MGTEDDVRGDEVAGEEVTGEEATEDAGPTDDGAGLVATEPGEPTGPAVAAVADPNAAVVPLP